MGIEAGATWKDSVITSYRDHCTHLGRGGSVLEVMAGNNPWEGLMSSIYTLLHSTIDSPGSICNFRLTVSKATSRSSYVLAPH